MLNLFIFTTIYLILIGLSCFTLWLTVEYFRDLISREDSTIPKIVSWVMFIGNGLLTIFFVTNIVIWFDYFILSWKSFIDWLN